MGRVGPTKIREKTLEEAEKWFQETKAAMEEADKAFTKARKRAEYLTRKLKEEGKMENIKEEIARKIELGILEEVPEGEWGEWVEGTYSFCYPSK